MKVLAIADREIPFDMEAVCREYGVNAIFLLGDLSYYYLQPLKDIALPILGVYGNHCRGDYFSELGAIDMHLRGVRLGDYTVAGIEGCNRYKAVGHHLYSQEEMRFLMRAIPAVDIILTHCPPRGINDDDSDDVHIGWECLRDYVQQHQPKHLFHGHTYPTDEELITQVGETQIHYVYGWEVIDLDLPVAESVLLRGYEANEQQYRDEDLWAPHVDPLVSQEPIIRPTVTLDLYDMEDIIAELLPLTWDNHEEFEFQFLNAYHRLHEAIEAAKQQLG